MATCERCGLADKILQCCGSYPPTGEYRELLLPDRRVLACPHLDDGGGCGIYERRPLNCRVFFCTAFAIDRARLDGRDGDGD